MSKFKCNRCGAAEGDTSKATGEAVRPMEPPHPNTYWNKVQSVVCQTCWVEWKDMEVKVINEYRLNLLEREHRKMLKKSMHDFLDLDGTGKGGQRPEAVAREWSPEG